MNPVLKLVSAAALATLFASPASAAKIYRHLQYYTVSGTTAKQLDTALTHKGPFLARTGSRHPGASRIRFDYDIKLLKDRKYCRVAKANIDVHATVSLPRWKQRARTSNIDLAIIWDVLAQDIKRHEESHVIIARSHASEMERTLHFMRYRRNCLDLQNDIEKTVTRILKHHDREQQQFDRVEARNFKRRFSRLLEQRLKNVVLIKNRKRYVLDFSK